MIRDLAHFLSIAAFYWNRANQGEACAHVARYYAHSAECVESFL